MKWIFACLATFWTLLGIAQTAPEAYYIIFSDKQGTPYSLNQPEAFLSKKSIERRVEWGIPLEWKDLPVNPTYVQSLTTIGNCHIHHTSKWFNSATLIVDDTLFRQQILDHVSSFPFVSEVKTMKGNGGASIEKDWTLLNAEKRRVVSFDITEEYEDFYGPSFRQVSMINAHLLHEHGYTGEGVVIAQFDSGWDKADQIGAFDRLRERGAILGTRDFVNPASNNVYNNSNHGTFVLSTMAGWIPDSLIGTSPDASYYLFRTEDVASEYLIEEDNWVAAAEYADSLGVDLINSSLGYSQFDDSSMNHTYADMNGETTRSSIAADIAASKGILVVNSAGNSGGNSWRFITAPSDGDSVLCVGAVNENEIKAWFSSFGPASDGAVKPNAMAMGQNTVFVDLNGNIRTGNGTSFSSPVLAGGAACIIQAVGASRKNIEILRAIEQSCNHYKYPTDSLGYGIADLWKALRILQPEWDATLDNQLISIYPNPTTNFLRVSAEWILEFDEVSYEISDASGRVVKCGSSFLDASNTSTILTIQWPESFLPRGKYHLRVFTKNESRITSFIVY
jgi:hypothetical protein